MQSHAGVMWPKENSQKLDRTDIFIVPENTNLTFQWHTKDDASTIFDESE